MKAHDRSKDIHPMQKMAERKGERDVPLLLCDPKTRKSRSRTGELGERDGKQKSEDGWLNRERVRERNEGEAWLANNPVKSHNNYLLITLFLSSLS